MIVTPLFINDLICTVLEPNVKITQRILIVALFATVYALLVGLGIECALNLLSLSFSVSIDSGTASAYPRFTPFCKIVGFSSLVALVGAVVLNIKLSDRLDYTDNMWKLQAALAVVLTLPMVKMWELLFEYLQRTL